MRERTNLTTLAEADSKTVQEARKILIKAKKAWAKRKTVEIRLNDIHNTSIITTLKKYKKYGRQYFIDKYTKVLSRKKITNEIYNRHISRFIG